MLTGAAAVASYLALQAPEARHAAGSALRKPSSGMEEQHTLESYTSVFCVAIFRVRRCFFGVFSRSKRRMPGITSATVACPRAPKLSPTRRVFAHRQAGLDVHHHHRDCGHVELKRDPIGAMT